MFETPLHGLEGLRVVDVLIMPLLVGKQVFVLLGQFAADELLSVVMV